MSFATIRESAAAILDDWRLKLANVEFLNLDEIKRELRTLLPQLILAAEATGEPGKIKRAAVLEGVGKWYDEVIAPSDIPCLPDWLVDPVVRASLVALSGEIVDVLVHVMSVYGVLRGGTLKGDAAGPSSPSK